VRAGRLAAQTRKKLEIGAAASAAHAQRASTDCTERDEHKGRHGGAYSSTFMFHLYHRVPLAGCTVNEDRHPRRRVPAEGSILPYQYAHPLQSLFGGALKVLGPCMPATDEEA
jgi:hypothetical protein